MSNKLQYFFEAYFHQDWHEDYESSLAAVRDFATTESDETVRELIQALESLQSSDDLPQDIINKLGGNFGPESEGMSILEWISKALRTLEK